MLQALIPIDHNKKAINFIQLAVKHSLDPVQKHRCAHLESRELGCGADAAICQDLVHHPQHGELRATLQASRSVCVIVSVCV